MKFITNFSLLFVVFLLNGCIISTKLPLISHVHVGHATTGWHDTPGQKGLLSTAAQEARTAAQHAEFAVESYPDLDAMKVHTKHVRHALDPVKEPKGPGMGYGMIRALEGASSHISFAEASDDASANIKNSTANWMKGADAVLERAVLIMELSEEINRSNALEDVAALTEEIRLLSWKIVNGEEGSGSGPSNQWGIRQLQQDLNQITDREEPAYAPVEQRYLFGLFRLPSGKWAFRDDIHSNTSDDGGGGY